MKPPEKLPEKLSKKRQCMREAKLKNIQQLEFIKANLESCTSFPNDLVLVILSFMVAFLVCQISNIEFLFHASIYDCA